MASTPVPPGKPDDSPATGVDRRSFLRLAGAGAGLALLGGCESTDERVPGIVRRRRVPLVGGVRSDIVVIGAGAWGGWTAYHLRKAGANVTLVDAYGPGNARSTSGDESRGIRSSYGDRENPEQRDLWMLWARESIRRWEAFDDEWSDDLKTRLYHKTGDLIFRAEWDNFTTRTREAWEKWNVPHQVLTPADVEKEFPGVFNLEDIGVVLAEPDAGVARARRSCQTVAAAFENLGGRVLTGRAKISGTANGRIEEIELNSGERLRADSFVFACGPWLGKVFPELLATRMRIPMGTVCYYGTPAGDERYTYPNLPSWNFPGVTGWAALPVDNRGFRVRGGIRAPAPADAAAPAGGRGQGATPRNTPAPAAGGGTPPTPPPPLDPDTSDRYPEASRLEGSRRFITLRFPAMANAPLVQTHMCHYESSSSRNFIIDRHPAMENVWIAGAGNAEGFKFAPIVGEYVAQRVVGDEGDPKVAEAFRIPKDEFESPTGF